MALHMTFGGSPCLALWGYITDTIADICNILLHCSSWDHTLLHDPISTTLSAPTHLSQSNPIHQSKDLCILIPPNDFGKVDVYIDDFIAITPDISTNADRLSAMVPLAIHSMARPIDPSDKIPRKDIISMKKFLAEGQLDEIKTILGWELNTRTLTVHLPKDKYNKWTKAIQDLVENTRASQTQLESTIGRINHAASILSIIRHFLGCLRHALLRSSKHGWTTLRLSEKSDLHLINSFLLEATNGISMNNLVFRKLSIINRSDASEFGIGGYNIASGRAWHLKSLKT
jgi:hypothetical protein